MNTVKEAYNNKLKIVFLLVYANAKTMDLGKPA